MQMLMNNPMQLLMQLQNSSDPFQMMNQMFGNNPMFNRAMQMGKGKSPEEIQQIIRNLAKLRGLNEEQLNQFLASFGMKI